MVATLGDVYQIKPQSLYDILAPRYGKGTSAILLLFTLISM